MKFQKIEKAHNHLNFHFWGQKFQNIELSLLVMFGIFALKMTGSIELL